MIPVVILPGRRMSHGNLPPGQCEIGCSMSLPSFAIKRRESPKTSPRHSGGSRTLRIGGVATALCAAGLTQNCHIMLACPKLSDFGTEFGRAGVSVILPYPA